MRRPGNVINSALLVDDFALKSLGSRALGGFGKLRADV
jgi:hypothetical protein